MKQNTKPLTRNIPTEEHTIANANSSNMKIHSSNPTHLYPQQNKPRQALKEKCENAFQVKFTSKNLKIMFANLNDFTDFKTSGQKKNIEYH